MAERTTELRRDIEATRERMTDTVDAIGDRVSPGRIAERRMASVRSATSRMRTTVMGAPRRATHDLRDAGSSATSSVGDTVHGAGERASSLASTASDQIGDAPQRVTQATQGNPLAAGAIAFGIGLLIGSLPPPTEEEGALVEKALPALEDEAKQMGQAVASTAQEGAQHAVAETRQAATEAADAVRERATDATGTVQDQAGQAATDVRDEVQSARDEVTGGPST